MEQLLTTKLFVPAVRPDLVPRPRLIERLNEGLRQNQAFGRKLTLVSAPAGFGKTTLVSGWLSHLHPLRIAWLSLDQGDNDLTRFLTYLVTALQTSAPSPVGGPALSSVEGTEPHQPSASSIGDAVLALLQSPDSPPVESILTVLLNEITAGPDDFVLVLDDYHVIDTKPVNEALTFLLEHLPPQMHLVIATREDPVLPLSRLRVRGQLTELRVADLRFTVPEAAEFFNRVMRLGLSPEQVNVLETRTEGWIAGLQLAALSLRGREDVSGFISAFAGDNRYVVDYLVEEVLQRQPEHVRSFLLQTSILERLSGSLCDIVTGQEQSRRILEDLERGNLFVIQLDDKRRWYRYHHLFADVLQAHLLQERPEQVLALHRRASQWYEENGEPARAIHHALAARDYERAAGLIELARPAMDSGYQSAVWLRWARALPDDLVRGRPVLNAGYGWALLDTGDLEASKAYLRAAERWLDASADVQGQMVVVDNKQFRSLPASLAAARAYRAMALGDVADTVKHAQQALDLASEDDHHWRGAASSLLGLAQYTIGNLCAADQSFSGFFEDMVKAGYIQNALGVVFLMGDIRRTLGRLDDGVRLYQESLQLAADQGEPMPVGTSDLYRGLGELYLERGDLEGAERQLLIGEKLGEQASLTDWEHRLCVSQARLLQARGDLEGALALLNRAESLHVRNPLPNVHPVAAQKARVLLRQGRLADAQDWVRTSDLSVGDDLNYLREFEHTTLGRVLIAQFRGGGAEAAIQDAVEMLERLLGAAEGGGRMGSAIEILALLALAHGARGDTSLALDHLARALTLSEPEGYFQTFVDEGKPMAGLLAEAARRGMAPVYAGRLLAALGPAGQAHEQEKPPLSGQQLLVEPLSQRELEVLRLVAQGLSNREIGERLFLALDTIKGHNRRIFGKLGVQRRTEAVARARELGLL